VKLDPDTCYGALLSHDRRFDGVFFVGVSTTGIYCRPICPARTPRRSSCTFYPSAAAAEAAGYRPCLRCRPELAPGRASVDAVSRLAASVAARIEDGALTELSVADLAEELGVSERHLRRVVQSEFGVSPVELAQTARLLLAKRLLTDTHLPVTEVAFASGFSSVRRFNAAFQERYRVNPTTLRKSRLAGASPEALVCELPFRAPLDWGSLLDFLGQRAWAGVEEVEAGSYARTVRIGSRTGWLRAALSDRESSLRVEVSLSLAPVLRSALARVRRLFDLSADPLHISQHLGDLARDREGLRVPGAFDGFETALRAVLGQQVSVAGATTLAARLAAAFGEPIETSYPTLTLLSPTAARLAKTEPEEVAAIGIPRSRASTLIELAKAAVAGNLILEPHRDPEGAIRRLKQIPGVGDWTAQYLGMRALGWPDAFPSGDLWLRKAFDNASPREVERQAEQWRPWRAYAAMHVWKGAEVIR
jgi:AraC family transcriptional regulator of adaptative response / DNA-3-methyladenine glycosylase II